jgi:glycine N-methyltransferase
MVDSVFRTRSLGVSASGLPDQYADGKVAKVWELYIGSKQERTQQYKTWIINTLRQHNCHHILDVACGTGVDSIMLVEEGFQVVSTDASDKMLKYALRERWERRKEKGFEDWVIEEANWMSLLDDFEENGVQIPQYGFDAVICLGNSFAHLPDFHGDQRDQCAALENMARALKPGGLLLIDHRNYDAILNTGKAPPGKNIYYPSSHIHRIITSNLYVDGSPHMITLDYIMDISAIMSKRQKKYYPKLSPEEQDELRTQKFRLSYYPHRLEGFKTLLTQAVSSIASHQVFGDFKELSNDYIPAYFIHAVVKGKTESIELEK